MLTRFIILIIIILVICVNILLFKNMNNHSLSASLIPGRNWLQKISNTESPFPLLAKAGIIINRKSGKILYQRNPDMQLPIASLTKLMTALAADYNQDLFYKMLVVSDNQAAEELAKDGLISAMNKKAQDLGLSKTHFADASGLEPGNISTASELLVIIQEVLKNKNLVKILSTKKYKNFENTNELLDLPGVIAGKTGFTDEAGQCLMLVTENYISIVLNADDRFEETKKLIELFE